MERKVVKGTERPGNDEALIPAGMMIAIILYSIREIGGKQMLQKSI